MREVMFDYGSNKDNRGLFHKWVQTNDGGLNLYAIIEDVNGCVKLVDFENVRFILNNLMDNYAHLL